MTPKGSTKLKDMLNEMDRHRHRCNVSTMLIAHGPINPSIIVQSGEIVAVTGTIEINSSGFKYFSTSKDGLYETYICESCEAAVTVPVGKREYYENDLQGLDE